MIYNFRVDDNLILKCVSSSKIVITDSVKYHIARFEFGKIWNDYSKTITFTNTHNNISIEMLLDENNECIIPWEVLEFSNKKAQLVVAVYGCKEDGSEIWTHMPTRLDFVKSDKTEYKEGQEPTKSIYQQILDELKTKGSSINYDEELGILTLNNNGDVLSYVELGTEDEDIDFDNIFDFNEDETEENADNSQDQDNDGQNSLVGGEE